MDTIEKICALIREKYEEFLSFEHQTERLLSCDIDEIENCMQQRQCCMDSISNIDNQLLQLAGMTLYPELTASVLKLKCNRDELPEELKCVFDSTLEVFSVVNRIIEMDKQVNIRVEAEKERLLEKIKSNNQSMHAHASKYYSNNTFGQSGTILNEKL